MAAVVVQLGDLHAKTGKELVLASRNAFFRAVEAEVDPDVSTCVIVFNGDAAYGAKPAEFEMAGELLHGLSLHLRSVWPNLKIYLLTVPGNHDCDLTSEDPEARLTLRQRVNSSVPPPSIANALLKTQEAYFDFAAKVGEPGTALALGHPFYRAFDLVVDSRRLRFHLLNSSWTSMLRESDDLRFPLEAFVPPQHQIADFSIAVLHHPLHWFLMPGVRRELRDILESHSDLVLTGHEHQNEKSRRLVPESCEITHIEAGVLHDHTRNDVCTFNVIRLNFLGSKQVVKRFKWAQGHFEPEGNSEETSLEQNELRRDRLFRLNKDFEQWLDELEDPLVHPRHRNLRLSHLFSYPDLRKIKEDSSVGSDSEPAKMIERVRSEDVVADLSGQPRSLITGADKSGKTSILKRLFADLHESGNAPL